MCALARSFVSSRDLYPHLSIRKGKRSGMKKNLVPLLGIAFVVAMVTTSIFYGLFVGKLGATAPTAVVVAAKDLKPGTTLNPDLVKVISWSSGSPPSGSFTSTEQVMGRTITQAVGEGDPVLAGGLRARQHLFRGPAAEPARRLHSCHGLARSDGNAPSRRSRRCPGVER